MHYHLEIIMPPTDDVESAVTEILAPFDENERDGEDASSCPFWDWWVIGGRWSGDKMLEVLGRDKVDEFQKTLQEANITVSSFRAGRPTLQPPEQATVVNSMWNAAFPDSPIKECPLFDNYKGSDGNVMKLSEVPPAMPCSHVIIADHDYENEKLEAKFMIQDQVWNGVNHIDTKWDGTLGGALAMNVAELTHHRPGWAARQTPSDDWLVVTVDYHS